MEIYSHSEIESLIEKEGNKNCIECKNAKPKWASVNNGVFLCLKCAGVHRNLGVDVTIIRSLQIDSWDDKQMLFLKKGGNDRFRDLLTSYNISPDASVANKYQSKAAEYYRKILRQEVEKELNANYACTDIEKPDISNGSEVIEANTTKKEISNDDLIGSQDKLIEPKNENFFDYVGGFFSRAKDQVVHTSKNLGETVSGLSEKLVERGQFVVEKGKEALNSQLIQGIAQTTEKGINAIVDKTKQILGKEGQQSEANPNSEKTTDTISDNNASANPSSSESSQQPSPPQTKSQP